MQSVLHVSTSALQKIVDELNDILHFSKYQSFQTIKEVLTKHSIEVDDCVVQDINNAIFKSNPLILTTEAKAVVGAFSSCFFLEVFPEVRRQQAADAVVGEEHVEVAQQAALRFVSVLSVKREQLFVGRAAFLPGNKRKNNGLLTRRLVFSGTSFSTLPMAMVLPGGGEEGEKKSARS
ncbi:hypothetical protein F7725_013993 [Dissostichus mawsoni]|uniref:Uncharacterized protein n=1 Tax=Dissostichus mawsoni TaxID=36200 RepID=A0A7J5YUY1_DISMA|nr:hypothetical protein F7725_013993 [Dissostichus mawsoni]